MEIDTHCLCVLNSSGQPGHQEEFSPTRLLETHHVRAMTWSHVHLEGHLRWHVFVCSEEARFLLPCDRIRVGDKSGGFFEVRLDGVPFCRFCPDCHPAERKSCKFVRTTDLAPFLAKFVRTPDFGPK